jgi:hypothetical protein
MGSAFVTGHSSVDATFATGESVRELSNWNSLTTWLRSAQARRRRPFACELRATDCNSGPDFSRRSSERQTPRLPNPKMTLALDIPAVARTEPCRFGSGRTSVHEMCLRDEPCSVRLWHRSSGGCEPAVRILYAQPASSVSARCGSADDLEDQIFTLIEPGPPESAAGLTGGHVASV